MSAITHDTLLAKGLSAKRSPLTLESHLQDTEIAAEAIFRPGSRWLVALLRFFRIDGASATKLRAHLRIAALAHDIGKANAHFQKAMRVPGTQQTIRHEHLSTLFLHQPEVAAWLRSHGLDHDAICAGVLSHHLKAGGDDWPFCQPRTTAMLRLDFTDAQIARIVGRMAEVLACPTPRLTNLPSRFDDALWQTAKRSVTDAARRFGRDVGERRKLALALKVGVIAADSVASAMVREGYSITEWVDEAAHAPALRPADVRADLLAPRIAQIEAGRGGAPFVPHRFQDGAAALPSRALLLAGCGSGKTLAAWRWAEQQLASHPAGRVVFLYPTRGTATEGFRDYVGWAPEGKAELLHGTARYELDAMLENPPDSVRGKNLADEAAARLFALGLWPKRYFSATVDQFLSFMEHRYESLCLVPALADSLIVLDEIHSYDGKMFASLLDFLKHFDVPVLAMTATLPPARLAQLEALGLRTYPQPKERIELADLMRAEEHPRYSISTCATRDEARARAVAAYEEGARVLWVVNVVRRCQELAQHLACELDLQIGEGLLAYHSRFRLDDRRRAHDKTVAAFRADSGRVIAVTTQVCEMSLDLDADVLVSEHAPIPSLVQRFGRANRHLRHGEDFRGELVLYAPETAAPYDEEDLVAAGAFIGDLPKEPSQRDLATKLEEHARQERAAPSDLSRFLNGGYYAVRGDFRDTDDFGRRCVLDSDLDEVMELVEQKKPIDGFVLSVPKRWILPKPDGATRLPRWLGVVSGEHYREQLGFVEPVGGAA